MTPPNRPTVLLAALALVAALAGCTGSPSAAGGATTAAPPSSATTAPAIATTSEPSAAPPAPAVTSPVSGLPIVPVVAYRSGLARVGWSDVAAALAGGGRWSALELVAADADAILTVLRASRPVDPARLVLVSDAAALAADLRAHPDRLGFLRAAEVGPSVRALAWGSRALFGVERLRDLDAWPLMAELAPAEGTAGTFDPSNVWTLWAGGDLGLDRTVAYVVKTLGKGIDYPFDGGRARIAGTVCCSAFGWPLPVIRTTGDGGAVRRLISGADLAMANLEEPAPDRWSYHPKGTVFTGDPALLQGLANAGIDVVSMANNHVGDAGPTGIVQTMRSLDRLRIRHAGAGKDLAAARRPALLELSSGVTVAFLAYDSIARFYQASATSAGSAPLTPSLFRRDIAAARKAGADLVVVYPHWGVEYTRGPSDFQRRMAHALVDAGADLVIGNHPHWVGAIETYRGRPIWYALGNFTFDQHWSEPTLEGIGLELTFRGRTLVQARLHPHVNVLAVQPNLLDPAGDGRRVLDPVFAASPALAW